MISSPRTPPASISCVTRATTACGLGKPFSGALGVPPPRGPPAGIACGAPHSGARSWLQLILMAIFSPGRYPEFPSLRVSLKLRNRASHACLSFFRPVRSWAILEVMPCTTFWSVLASSHQCPVVPSQLVAFASWTHTTRPGWIPFAMPIGLLVSSVGLNGSGCGMPPRCCAMASRVSKKGTFTKPAAGATASDLRKHLRCINDSLHISHRASGPAGRPDRLPAPARWCPGRESNPHSRCREKDFKSFASACFATRAPPTSVAEKPLLKPPEILHREAQPLLQPHARLPPEYRARLADVRAPLLGVVLGQRLERDLRLAPRHAADPFGEFQNRHLARIPQVHRIPFLGEHQPGQPLHHVAHVTEAARLRAIAKDREGLAAQGLIQKCRHHAAVVQLHARAVSIEDARDVRPHAMLAVIRHGEGFGETLAFVVAGARPHRVYVPPVGLHLRMDQRVAVTSRRGGHQVSRAFFASQFQHAARPHRPHVQRFDGMLQIVLGAGRTSHVHHTVDGTLDRERLRDVPLDKTEPRLAFEMSQVAAVPRQKIIQRHHAMAIPQKTVAHVRSDESRGPRDDDSQVSSEKPYSS